MRHPLNLSRFLTIFILVLFGSGVFFHSLAMERLRWKLQIAFGIGQIGFQVIAISFGRRASGEWKA